MCHTHCCLGGRGARCTQAAPKDHGDKVIRNKTGQHSSSPPPQDLLPLSQGLAACGVPLQPAICSLGPEEGRELRHM